MDRAAQAVMPERLRVGLLVDTLVGGGAERMSLTFAECFRAMGHDAHVILLRDVVEHDTRGVPVHALSDTARLHALRPLNKLMLARRLRQTVRRIEADGKPFDFFISNAEDMDRISAMARLPTVFIRYRNSLLLFLRAKVGNATGVKRYIRAWRWMRKFRRIYGGRHIVAISKAMERELVQDCGIEPASITTIYNPFDFERIRALAQEPVADLPTQPYILYVARMSGRKDQETLIRAYAEARLPHLLVLLGGTTSAKEEAYRKHIETLIAELGLGGRVLMPGFRANPYPWIRHAALFALSSRSEGLPLVLVEALILGTPVVSTDCPTGPGEILAGDLARFLSPVGDVPALAANLRAALAGYPKIDPALLERFRDDYAINRYLAHFRRITGGRDRATRAPAGSMRSR